MITYDGFKEKYYPGKKLWRYFDEAEILAIDIAVPKDVIDFLEIEGLSSYANGFMWTLIPNEYHRILTAWGMDGEKCFAFLRSAFGALVFYFEKQFYYLDPLGGRIISIGDDFYFLLNYMIRSETILENGFFENYYLTLPLPKDALEPDEVFAFVPALPIGGNPETSKIEIVKMKEHLYFLAQLFDGKATRV